jgi:hypothetical protein
MHTVTHARNHSWPIVMEGPLIPYSYVAHANKQNVVVRVLCTRLLKIKIKIIDI